MIRSYLSALLDLFVKEKLRYGSKQSNRKVFRVNYQHFSFSSMMKAINYIFRQQALLFTDQVFDFLETSHLPKLFRTEYCRLISISSKLINF